MKGFEDRNIITELDKITGDGQSRGSGADNGDLFTVGGRNRRDVNGALVSFIIGGKSLQAADGHGLPFLAQDAGLFTLIFLGTDAAADGGEAIRFFQGPGGPNKISLGNLEDEFRDPDVDGAAVHTSGLLALDAAPRFQYGRLRGITARHFVKVLHPVPGVLLRHRLAPRFAHHALILGQDRAKLSKRHGATAVREFRERGILPEVLLNYLALLGASFGEGKEVFTTEEMIDAFSLDRAGKSGAIFDEDKLLWLNSLYIRKESPETLAGHMRPFISAAGYDHLAEVRLHKIIEAVRDNLTNLTEIGNYLRIFDDNAYELSVEALQLLGTADAKKVIVGLLGLLDDPDAVPAEDDRLYVTLMPLMPEKTGLRGKKLFMPIRAAITGRTKGPELDRCFAVLGKASLQHRLHRAITATA